MWGFQITHCPRHLHHLVLAIDFFCLNSKLGSSRLTHFQLDSKQLDHKDSHRSLKQMLLAFSGDILLVPVPNPKCRRQDGQEVTYTGRRRDAISGSPLRALRRLPAACSIPPSLAQLPACLPLPIIGQGLPLIGLSKKVAGHHPNRCVCCLKWGQEKGLTRLER